MKLIKDKILKTNKYKFCKNINIEKLKKKKKKNLKNY